MLVRQVHLVCDVFVYDHKVRRLKFLSCSQVMDPVSNADILTMRGGRAHTLSQPPEPVSSERFRSNAIK